MCCKVPLDTFPESTWMQHLGIIACAGLLACATAQPPFGNSQTPSSLLAALTAQHPLLRLHTFEASHI